MEVWWDGRFSVARGACVGVYSPASWRACGRRACRRRRAWAAAAAWAHRRPRRRRPPTRRWAPACNRTRDWQANVTERDGEGEHKYGPKKEICKQNENKIIMISCTFMKTNKMCKDVHTNVEIKQVFLYLATYRGFGGSLASRVPSLRTRPPLSSASESLSESSNAGSGWFLSTGGPAW